MFARRLLTHQHAPRPSATLVSALSAAKFNSPVVYGCAKRFVSSGNKDGGKRFVSGGSDDGGKPDLWTHMGNVGKQVWRASNEEISGRVRGRGLVSYVKTAYCLPIIVGKHYVRAVTPLSSIAMFLIAITPVTNYWVSLTTIVTMPVWVPLCACLALS